MSVIIDNVTYFTGPLYTSTIISNNNISIKNNSQHVRITTQNTSCTNLISNNLNVNNINSTNNYIELKKPHIFVSPSYDSTINFLDVSNNYLMTTSNVVYNPINNINVSTTKNYIINLSAYQYPDISFATAFVNANNYVSVNNYVSLNNFSVVQSSDITLANLILYNFGTYLVYYGFVLFTDNSSQPANTYNTMYTSVTSDSSNNNYRMGHTFTGVPIVYNSTYGDLPINISNMGIFNITRHPDGKNFSTLTLFLKFYLGALPSIKLNMLNSNLNLNTNNFTFYAIKLS